MVVETDSRDRDREIWHWLQELTGVAMVDVALVGFEEVPEASLNKDDESEPE